MGLYKGNAFAPCLIISPYETASFRKVHSSKGRAVTWYLRRRKGGKWSHILNPALAGTLILSHIGSVPEIVTRGPSSGFEQKPCSKSFRPTFVT